MKVCLIAAMGSNRAIGIDGGLPWRLPADLKRFKALTLGHILVMGRKTFESIGRPLPGRTTIVVTRQEGYAPEGVLVADSFYDAMAQALVIDESEDDRVFVAGGEEIFRQSLGMAEEVYLTLIHQDFPADTFFPDFEGPGWRLAEREDHKATARTPLSYSFLVFERAQG
ncbi:MAG TPA: dihydrofolate reductase [Thermoanaerobaculia bacterium]|nr:dihydrofolate reductase [Thermoanaerobaculia bacterium]